MARQFFATEYAYGRNPAVECAQVYTGAGASGAQTLVITPGQMPNQVGRVFPTFSTHSPILIGAGSNQETVTPSAVTLQYQVPVATSALVTATFSNTQGQGAEVASGTFGLQEAILSCMAGGGGIVWVDSLWTAYGGTTAMLAAAYGDTTVQIFDARSGTQAFYQWNGTGFVAGAGSSVAAPVALTTNGAVPVTASGNYVITKAGVLADTIAAPAAGANGITITITSATANAHTFTATGLYNTGSAAVNLATYAAFAGATMTLQAYAQKWNVVSSVGVTFS